MPTQAPQATPSNGARLVTADGRTLPLRATRLTASAGGGLCRTRLEQRFENPHRDPLTVTYELPLPADGAVASFAFRIGERRVEGEIEGREAARARFEQALADGHSAGLVEQERASLFRQELGNIPPGAEVVAELEVDQLLAWVADGGWEWRFPTTVAPRYLGAPGRVPDAERITVDVADGELPARLSFELAIDDPIAGGGAPESPSHELAVDAGGVVRLAAERARMDRDVVVRWPVATPAVGARLVTARPATGRQNSDAAHGLLTLVPPSSACTEPPLARDLVVLIDTSGSMQGQPLDQARAVVSELVRSLGPRDTLELIEFSSAPRRWRDDPTRTDEPARADALCWLAGLRAGGATEMRAALVEALNAKVELAQRQVLLVSDGHIGFEREIVQEVLALLPGDARLHTLGVGAAPNRTLTAAAARAGRGAEALVGLDDEPRPAARRLLAATRAPRVVDLELSGSALVEHAPERLPDLFDGAPTRVSLALRPAGGALVVRGRTAEGAWHQELQVPPTEAGAGRGEVVTRFGRERVEDLEMRAATGEGLDAEIEALGREFALATRRTSWVAISSEPTVDPRQPTRRERVPQELPFGTTAEGFGLRPAEAGAGQALFARALPPHVQESIEHFQQLRAPKHRAVTPEPRRVGSIRRRGDGVLVIELEGDGRAWKLPRKVELVWAGGERIRARVDADLSTRSGDVTPGGWIRLRLLLPPHAPTEAPIRLSFRVRGRKTELELS